MNKTKNTFSSIIMAVVICLSLGSSFKAKADCGPELPYIGTYIPYYELGQQVGVQCVLGGNICKCIGEIYWW